MRFLSENFITRSDLKQIETYADRLFAKVGIDVEFTRHFLDRVNDEISQIDIDFENVGDTIPQNILEQMLEEEAGTSPVNMNRNYQRPEDYE